MFQFVKFAGHLRPPEQPEAAGNGKAHGCKDFAQRFLGSEQTWTLRFERLQEIDYNFRRFRKLAQPPSAILPVSFGRLSSLQQLHLDDGSALTDLSVYCVVLCSLRQFHLKQLGQNPALPDESCCYSGLRSLSLSSCRFSPYQSSSPSWAVCRF